MPGYSEKSVPDLMNVATAVVVCAKKEWKGNLDQYPVLIGWEDARLHLDCIAPNNPQFVKSKDAPSFTFSAAGYRAAVHLLGLLGLSPTTTKANVLEGLRARFICVTCTARRWSTRNWRQVMTFKKSVSHAIGCPGRPESLVELTVEGTESVLLHERACLTLPAKSSWSCLHCSDYFQNLGKRKAVVLHVHTVHSIQRPIENVDFLLVKQKNQPPREEFFLALVPPTNYRCDRCPDTKKCRLWCMKPLLSHLLDKHGIKEPVEDVDWHQVELWKGGALEMGE